MATYEGEAQPSRNSIDGSSNQGQTKKRVRLSCACERCRKKKIKCDEQVPACLNCQQAGVECVVTKPSQNSYVEPVRRKTGMAMPVRQRKRLEKAAQKGKAIESIQQVPTFYQPIARTSTLDPAAQTNHISPGSNSSTTYNNAAANGISLSDAETLLLMRRQQSAAAAPTADTTPAFSNTSPHDAHHHHPRVNDIGLWNESNDPERSESRRKFNGASSSNIFLKWLDSQTTGTKLSQHLQYGIAGTDEYTFPAALNSASTTLPSPELTNFFLDRYFVTVHYMFPVVDEAVIRSWADQREALLTDKLRTVLFQLVLSHGAETGDPSPEYSAQGEALFQQAWLALPAVMASPFRLSVQILCLISQGLRSRNKDGAAWVFAGFAARTAQSLGLHHHVTGPFMKMDARIFYCVYCLDKMLSFECGRPSAINDNDCTIAASDCGDDVLLPLSGRPALNIFKALISICQEMSHISSNLFKRGAVQLTTIDALRFIGDADARLMQWSESLPIELRPNLDGNSTEPWLLPFTARIHCMFFLALTTLHRLSLFDEGELVMPNLNHPVLVPYASRLRTSGLVCTQAARATLTLLERLSLAHPADRSWTNHCVLTAIYVIAIRTYKQPFTWQAKADLMFLKNACDFAEARYRELGFDERFIEMLPKLYAKIEAKVTSPNMPSRPGTRQNTPGLAIADQHPTFGAQQDGRNQTLVEGHSSTHQADGNNGWSFPQVSQWLSQSNQLQPPHDTTDPNVDPSLQHGNAANGISELWPLLIGDGLFDDSFILQGF